MTLADWALVSVHVSLAAWVSAHALLNKRDPRSAWAWTLAAALLPLAGPFLYVLLGINRIERRARIEIGPEAAPESPAPPDAVPLVPEAPRIEVQELVRLGRSLTGRALLAGNQVTVLHDGEGAYPAMLDAIARARTRVWLMSYIFDDGVVGKRFAHALAAGQARGVEVRVLLDGIGDIARGVRGSHLLGGFGVPVRRFIPPRLFPPLLHVNLRNHRKLLVTDEDEAFLGGINVGDHHLLRRGPRHGPVARADAADLHFSIRGPVVGQLARVFAQDWAASGGERLEVPAAPAGAGDVLCRAVTSGPADDIGRLQLLLLGALANAHRSVQIMTPYFIPTAELSSALEAAAIRGVEVSLVLPERSDHPWLDAATRRWLPYMIERGVHVYLNPPPFAHSKLFVVDGYYALVGSANLDPRSLRLNFELLLEIFDMATVGALRTHVTDAIAASRPLTAQALRALPLSRRLLDSGCWLFSPYL